ncbi:MAG: glycerol-3-phosphate dehydrogenase C-terminal domain-containing protein, partial [Fusobacteriaceae bacterium]
PVFPNLNLTLSDIESSWAGVRPLIHEEGKSPSAISRKEEILFSKSGLMSIAGGKLTGYRKMAEDIINKIQSLNKSANSNYERKKCCTKNLRLDGGEFENSSQMPDYFKKQITIGKEVELSEKEIQWLFSMFGKNIEKVFEIIKSAPKVDMKNFEKDKSIYGALIYGLDYESILTPLDFIQRRSGLLYFNYDKAKEYQQNITSIISTKLNYSPEETERYSRELEAEIKSVVAFKL